MTTTTLNKTVGTNLFAHAACATATVTIGSEVDVSTKMAGRIFVWLGHSVATALTNEVTFRLEGAAKVTSTNPDNDRWVPLFTWTSTLGKTARNKTTLNDASCNAGDTTFVLTSGTGFGAGDTIFLRETGTPANSEWARGVSLATNTVTIEAGLERNHTNGIDVTDGNELFTFDVGLSAVTHVRLVVDTNTAASGQTVDVAALLNTLDSASTA